MAEKTMFELLCLVLNQYNPGDVVDIHDVCRNSLFVDNGYSFVYMKDQIIQYLYLLGKNSKKEKFVKFSTLDDKVRILKKITDFKTKNYKNAK